MDYTYLAPPGQVYPLFGMPAKPGHPYTPQEETQNNPFEAYNDPSTFQYFDQSAQFNATSIAPPPQSPPHSLHRPSLSHLLPYDSSSSIPNEPNGDIELDQTPGRSSDDDKDNLTPAQSRRKAQNRVAQRAFRERKEQRVKNLELKLKSMEATSTNLLSDNERLKRELERVATQNEILRATSTPMNISKQPQTQQQSYDYTLSEPEHLTSGPMKYSPRTFNAAVTQHYPASSEQPMSHRIAISAATCERLLATGAAWDLIQNHKLFRRGLVDLGEVCDRLKDRVECDGSGPTFPEDEVIKAIEESVGVGGDELI